jgi:DNA (cytosine-5)-methyltransferase 1
MGADDYAIDVPLNQALFGFGDAVCVPVIKWIADNYLNPVFSELLQAHRKKGCNASDEIGKTGAG